MELERQSIMNILSVLKQYKFIILQFCRLEVWWAWLISLLKDKIGLNYESDGGN